MTPEIINKIKALLDSGITTEAQVVYLLVQIRKVIEQENHEGRFKYLKFHCDWALHSFLSGPDTQEILAIFDGIHVHYCEGNTEEELPPRLQNEFQKISRMALFKEQITDFFKEKNIPAEKFLHSNNWVHFQYLYTLVIKDCPLVLINKNPNLRIKQVNVGIQLAAGDTGRHILFAVIWDVLDKDNNSGSHAVYNSYVV